MLTLFVLQIVTLMAQLSDVVIAMLNIDISEQLQWMLRA
jgi:hypothetical protein